MDSVAASVGVQESTLRVAVAEVVPAHRRGTAYGVFAAGSGSAAFAGSALLALLYTPSLAAVVSVTAAIQLMARLVFVCGYLRLGDHR
ncbi:hypothetical protein ACIBG0_04570 [Nocardia sp. NPDC050630]|uniref:hypothetical protein n=1 Tax=Nocardia sp. NPDC050630 TaxID=3364321 RepID=UPI0037B47A13